MHIGMSSEMGGKSGVTELTLCRVASSILRFFHAVTPLHLCHRVVKDCLEASLFSV